MPAIASWIRDHKRAVMLGGLVVLLIVGAWLALRSPAVTDALAQAAEWMQSRRALGTGLLVAATALAIVLVLPTTPFHVSAGVVFGTAFGLGVALLGNLIGGMIAFGLGRTLLRERVQRRLRNDGKLAAITRAMSFKPALLVQLSPVIPFSAGQYVFGLTRLGVAKHVAAMMIGCTPGTLFNVWLGAAVGRAALYGETGSAGSTWTWVGLAATGVIAILLGWWGRRAVRATA